MQGSEGTGLVVATRGELEGDNGGGTDVSKGSCGKNGGGNRGLNWATSEPPLLVGALHVRLPRE
jgi:hypothetical protein